MNKNNFKQLCYLCYQGLLIILFLVHGHVIASQYSEGEIKSALLSQIIKNTTWQKKENTSTIEILIYKDPKTEAALSPLESVKLKGKNVSVKFVDSLAYPFDAHIVYVSELFRDDVNTVASLLRNTNTLLITENSSTLHNVMINIKKIKVESSNKEKISFQINRPNLAYEKLNVSPDLILYGGTELDIAELYYETEKAMSSLRDENDKVSQQLNQFKQQLAATESKLEFKNKALLVKSKELKEKETKSSELTQSLKKQERKSKEQLEQLDMLTNKVITAHESYTGIEQELINKSTALRESEKLFEEQQEAVTQQLNVLERLQAETTQQSMLLTQMNKKVEDQADVIDAQTVVIGIVIFIVLLVVLVSAIIAKLLFKNKRMNQQLQSSNEYLKSAQKQLVESEKMASLGSLVAGVAHELNTPIGISLTAITTVSDETISLERKLTDNVVKKSDLTRFIDRLCEVEELVQRNLERCHTLIQSFKQISSDQSIGEQREIHLKDYLNDIFRTLSIYLKKEKVEYRISGENPTTYLDPGILNQVFNNLVTNSVQHAFESCEAKALELDISTDANQIALKFKDNGIGMNKKVRGKIFDPFFTTKRGRGGTGLGLNIVYTLVTQKLNGEIIVNSQVSSGTEFVITMPIITRES